MASPTQIAFLKVLACMAWADGAVNRAELSLIGSLMHELQLSGEERLQVEMYLEEKVGADEARRVTRRFLAHVHRPSRRQYLIETVEKLLDSDARRTPAEREWLQELRDAVAESSGRFLLDGLRSILRIGAGSSGNADPGREAELYDFIHNRVLFKLRRRVGAKALEQETKPDKLKEMTLCAGLLAQVGCVDEEFLPQEEQFMQKVFSEVWGISPSLAEALCAVAVEAVDRGLDLFRHIQEARANLSDGMRKTLLEALFGLAQARGKMGAAEIEEIRKIAHGLDFTHREFIAVKLKVLGRDSAA
jgi:uncharacterized tellurite resistance protein B-like protein